MPFVVKDSMRQRCFVHTVSRVGWDVDLNKAKRFRSVGEAKGCIDRFRLDVYEYIIPMEVEPDPAKQRFKQ